MQRSATNSAQASEILADGEYIHSNIMMMDSLSQTQTSKLADAAALSMQKVSEEIVAILTESMHSMDATRDMATEVSATLISTAWFMQRIWKGESARPAFVP